MERREFLIMTGISGLGVCFGGGIWAHQTPQVPSVPLRPSHTRGCRLYGSPRIGCTGGAGLRGMSPHNPEEDIAYSSLG